MTWQMWSEFAQLASAEMGNQNWKSWSKECDCFAQNYTYHGSMADLLLYQSIKVVKPKLRMILLVQSGRCEVTNTRRLETWQIWSEFAKLASAEMGRIRIGRERI